MLSDLANLSSYEDRLQFAGKLLNKSIKMSVENIILIAQRFHNKLLLAEKYVPAKKIPCQTTLFRVQTASEYSGTMGDDYGLSTVRKGDEFVWKSNETFDYFRYVRFQCRFKSFQVIIERFYKAKMCKSLQSIVELLLAMIVK